jgi:hypothetical protein
VACALGVPAPLELMVWVAHAGKIIAATTGKRHFIRNPTLILPMLNNMPARLATRLYILIASLDDARDTVTAPNDEVERRGVAATQIEGT